MHPDAFGIHWDTGHYHSLLGSRALGLFWEVKSHIYHFEFANVGREPLMNDRGIIFDGYFSAMSGLPGSCMVGTEPFSQKVISAFNLRKLCSTKYPGVVALTLDAGYLMEKGIMRPVGE
jgi:hypothetical protein